MNPLMSHPSFSHEKLTQIDSKTRFTNSITRINLRGQKGERERGRRKNSKLAATTKIKTARE
jgi:hypothetical protein